MFAVQAEGAAIRTVEGLANGDELHPLQQAFSDHHALQCGFCTPGFLMLAVGALEAEPEISDEELRDVLSSNLCRCTGYQNILKAVRAAADQMSGDGCRRPVGPAARGPAAAHRAGPLRRRHQVSPPASHARRALAGGASAGCSASTCGRPRPCRAWSAVWTGADVATIPPIDFRQVRVAGLEPYRQPILAPRQGALRRRAGRGRVRRRSLPRRGRRRARLRRHRGPAAALDADRTARRIRRQGSRPRRRSSSKGYGDVDCRLCRGAARGRARRSPSAGTAASPLETRGAIARLRCRPATLLEIHGAAKMPHYQPRRARRAPRPAARAASTSTRATSAAASASGARSTRRTSWSASPRSARAAGQVDRGPARASDRRQPLTRPGPQDPRCGRRATASSSPSTTSSGPTRAPTCAPMPPPSPI